MNSFRFLERGIEAEIARQRELLESGEEVAQETLHFHPEDGSLTPAPLQGVRARLPLLPGARPGPGGADRGRCSSEARESLPELPAAPPRALRDRGRALRGGGEHPRLPRRVRRVLRAGGGGRRRRTGQGDRQLGHRRAGRRAASGRRRGGPARLQGDARRPSRRWRAWSRPRRSPTAPASRCWRSWSQRVATPAQIVESEGLAQISDTSELEGIVDRAIEAEPEAAEQVRAGQREGDRPDRRRRDEGDRRAAPTAAPSPS